LTNLMCNNNQLSLIVGPLPVGLKIFYAYQNQLASIGPLPFGLQSLIVHHNCFSMLPDMPLSLFNMIVCYNPGLIYRTLDIACINETNLKIKKFVFLYFCLRFRAAFRRWLWEGVRLRAVNLRYHPSRVAWLLEEGGVELEELEMHL